MARFDDEELVRYEQRLLALRDDIDHVGGQIRAADTGARLQLRRATVARALGRIVEGTFGRCVSCGGDVEAPRLEERPDAERCARCDTTPTTR
jgi:DnaK suppressor protein